jgi:hypothetical protein
MWTLTAGTSPEGDPLGKALQGMRAKGKRAGNEGEEVDGRGW